MALSALMEAEVAKCWIRPQDSRTAKTRLQAAQLAQQDVSKQQAGMLNAQQALRAALANQQAGLTAGQSNLQATTGGISKSGALTASEFNIGQDASAQALNQAMGLDAGQALGAANQLANLGLSGVEMGQTS